MEVEVKVKIQIEVEVPKGCKFVAVDEDGSFYRYTERPVIRECGFAANSSPAHKLKVSNWRETLTEVRRGADGDHK